MSLYANLLETDSASISRDPVLFKDGDGGSAKKAIDPGMSTSGRQLALCLAWQSLT